MSNVIKGSYGYSFQEDETRVIDANEQIASRLAMLSEIMRNQAGSDESFGEDFTKGLDAVAVEQLLMDQDSEDGADNSQSMGSVIKAASSASAAEAEAQANEILTIARNQADEIVLDAQEQAEKVRRQAIEEGQRIGYDEGFERGRNEAMAELDAQKAEIAALKEELIREFDERLEELEPKFVEVLTDVYEHIFHVKLSDNKEIIYYLIQDAVRKIENNKNFIIHVSKEDYGFVSMQKKELLAGIAGGDVAEIVEDLTLKPNECLIDTGSGIFDCSLETQLAGLKRELRLLSFNSSL